MIAVAANTVFKAGLAGFLAAPGLRNVIAIATAVILTAAAASVVWL